LDFPLSINRRFGLAVMSAAAVATACVDQSPVDPSADTLVVQAVLDAAANEQFIIVQATNGAIGGLRAVSGASVTITLPDGRSLAADEDRDSTVVGVRSGEPRVTTVYRLVLDRLGVVLTPGGTYRLRIVVPDRRVVTGATTIPSIAPSVDPGPLSAFDMARDTLRLNWIRVPGAASYEAHVHSPQVDFNVFVDTSIVLTGDIRNDDGDRPFVRGSTDQLIISAVDANYYDYYRRSADPFTGVGTISRLNGALGVFGSITEITRRTLVVQ
jgi:hypothetical protein